MVREEPHKNLILSHTPIQGPRPTLMSTPKCVQRKKVIVLNQDGSTTAGPDLKDKHLVESIDKPATCHKPDNTNSVQQRHTTTPGTSHGPDDTNWTPQSRTLVHKPHSVIFKADAVEAPICQQKELCKEYCSRNVFRGENGE